MIGEWIISAGGGLGVLAVLRFAAVPIARSVVILISGIYANVHPDAQRRGDSQRIYEIADRDRQQLWPSGRLPEKPLTVEPPDPRQHRDLTQ